MITMRDRVRRPIQANLKRFIFVVVVFSLALCLLGQIALSFYCFYDSHRGVMGDEVSVFLDSSLTDAQRKKAQEQIRALAPITEFREIKPTDVLEKDILKLVGMPIEEISNAHCSTVFHIRISPLRSQSS